MPDPAYVLLEQMLRAIEMLGRRSWPDAGPLPDPDRFPWLMRLAAATEAIAAESQQFLRRFEPADTRSLTSLPVGVSGSWQLVPLVDRAGRYPHAAQFPATIRLLAQIPRLRAADLAVLAADSRIHPHRGNNWGVLRAHLTLVEPAGEAICALRFPQQGLAVPWHTGEAFIFDDSFEHDAVNGRDSGRLVLLAEVDRPLPPGLARLNALCQRWYRHHPVQRGVRDRAIARYSAASRLPSCAGSTAPAIGIPPPRRP